MSEEGFPIVSVGVALHSQHAAAQISGPEADLGYWFFFLSSCWLFIIHNRLRVLFHSLFHWHGRVIHYSWFSKPKYSLFIFLFNPAIHYSPSTPKQITRQWNVHFWWLLGKHFQDRTSSPDCFTCCRVLCVVKIWKQDLLEIYLELTASNVALPAIPRCSS